MSISVNTLKLTAKRPMLALICLFTMLGAIPVMASDWSMHNLGTLGGDFSVATGINNLGQVVGYSLLPPRPVPGDGLVSFPNAFLSAPNGGPITSLGELGETGSRGTGVNDLGQGVGTSELLGNTPGGFITGPKGKPIGEISGFITPIAINNKGQVAGRDDNSGFAFITAPHSNTLIPINTPDGFPTFESATAINNSGLVTLDSGYVWSQSGGRQTIAPGVQSAAGLNDAGQVIGQINGSAFITAPDIGALTMLDTLGGSFSIATGINNFGQVVGLSETADGLTHAFVTGANGAHLIDLENLQAVTTAGFSELTVAAINDLGQIAGTGMFNGAQRAFLLSPVPEPAAYALMLLGLGLLGLMRTRRRQDSGDRIAA